MKIINSLLSIVLGLCIVSCEDIMEKDITNNMVSIVYPLDNAEVNSNVVSFKWNSLKGAEKYRLQVYSVSQFIVLDSVVTTTNFTYSLGSGMYQWRVRAENFAYETSYTFPTKFTMIESDDLANQQVPLGSPSSGIYSNQINHNFSWTRLSAADSYSFQLVNVTEGNTIVHQKDSISGTYYSLPAGTINQDGEYFWKVKALNSANRTETSYSSRTLYIDTTAPGLPQNLLPVNNDNVSVNTSINFQWNSPLNNSPVNALLTYNIQIASDSGFTNIIQTDNITALSYSYSFSRTGTYYWRIKAFDSANNQGVYNGGFKIVVQ